MIKQVPDDETNRQHKEKLQHKHTSVTQLSFAERALLQEHNRFLAEINNEAKVRRSTKSEILVTVRVMRLRKSQVLCQRQRKPPRPRENVVGSARVLEADVPEVDASESGKGKRGQKRKSPEEAGTPEPKAKVTRMSEA
jgi:hypothetical protein